MIADHLLGEAIDRLLLPDVADIVRIGLSVDDADRSPFPFKGAGDLSADAARSAGDDDNLITNHDLFLPLHGITPVAGCVYKRRETIGDDGLFSAPGAIRTPGPFLRREVLYPAELLAHASDCFRQYNKKRPRLCRSRFVILGSLD